MKKKRRLKMLGALIGLAAMTLAWVFFGWKLTLILMLALWANNLEVTNRS